MGQSGRHRIWYVNIGTSASPDMREIGFQQGSDIQRTRAVQTAEHKSSNSAISIVGSKTHAFTINGLRTRSDIGIARVKRLFDTGEVGIFHYKDFGVAAEEVQGYVTSISEGDPVDGFATLSWSISPSQEPTQLA